MGTLFSARTRTTIADLGGFRTVMVCVGVLLAAGYLGFYASSRWLVLSGIAIGSVILLQRPQIGLVALAIAALVVPVDFGTGTEVTINVSMLLVVLLLSLWLLDCLRRGSFQLARARANRPLLLFLLSAVTSLVVGNVLWDPAIPRSDNFILVQLGQWAIFGLSAAAFWLSANLLAEESSVRRLTWVFLLPAGSLAVLVAVPGLRGLAYGIATKAIIRAPFWGLLTALSGGQLLFNKGLGRAERVFLVAALCAALWYVLVVEQQAASNWLGVAIGGLVLVWLRFPGVRWPMALAGPILLVVFFPALYEFAGGDTEWIQAGAPRLELIRRVVGVSLRNPVLGLGPASYRAYARVEPLQYRSVLWWNPNVASHNNYVDLFAQTGLLGLGLFGWFIVEVIRLAVSLVRTRLHGFLAGYVNGMLAALAGVLVTMLLADWFLPFVYNIGFPGFQASVLAWMFLGGLVAVDRFGKADGPVDRRR